ncbi:DNA clamp loader [Catenaria anguillulae PL171]|uniref:Replication factor C subunit 5 n=1 Tax=Catenaria anguillulae PL171 TaxID=765915 RepID=A0A1Y2I1L6_9FUNG|nr:DNA clamp loader [Catenaria anguillulae PL171]
MALWIDKYRPTTLQSLDYHEHLSTHLDRLTQTGDFPHLLVFGPQGAGKRTRVMATLRALYGPGVDKVKLDHRQIVTPSNRKIDLTLLVSNYHIEINPTDAGNNDRLIVQDLIKEIAQTQNIDAASANRFKAVVISDADNLSLAAQHALRRTMEKYMANLRIILCCTSSSKIIPAIQSRCLLVRVAAPTAEERNLRRAILMLEALYVQSGSPSHISANTDLSGIEYDWEAFLSEIANNIIAEQSADRLALIRPKLYDLLVHCIPPSVIIKTLAMYLTNRVPEGVRADMISITAHYEYSMCQGTKPIFHLEAFVAKAMATYKRFQLAALSG